MRRSFLFLAPLLLAISVQAQQSSLSGGTLTVDSGTLLELVGPLEWTLQPDATVVNDGTIDLGTEAVLIEADGRPITGLGTEHALRTMPAGTPPLEPGGLGLTLSSTADLGTVDVQRGHTTITPPGGATSIARWYALASNASPVAPVALAMTYDAVELNGADADDLILHGAAALTGPWSPVDGSAVAGPQLLTAEATAPWGYLTAFPEVVTNVPTPTPMADFTVWPTVTDGPVHVVAAGREMIRSWALTDASGRITRSGTFGEDGRRDLSFDTSDLRSGLFVLHVNGVHSWKLIKP